jgi:hypothetical protein
LNLLVWPKTALWTTKRPNAFVAKLYRADFTGYFPGARLWHTFTTALSAAICAVRGGTIIRQPQHCRAMSVS